MRQMPLAIDEMYLLKGVETIVAAGNAGASARIDFEKAAESLVGFWDLLLEKLPVNYPKLTVQLKLGSLKHPKDILAATSESEFPAIVYKRTSEYVGHQDSRRQHVWRKPGVHL